MEKLRALSLLAESFISTRPRPSAEDFDVVAVALSDVLPEAAQHAAETAACLREAGRSQLTLTKILQETAQ